MEDKQPPTFVRKNNEVCGASHWLVHITFILISLDHLYHHVYTHFFSNPGCLFFLNHLIIIKKRKKEKIIITDTHIFGELVWFQIFFWHPPLSFSYFPITLLYITIDLLWVYLKHSTSLSFVDKRTPPIVTFALL